MQYEQAKELLDLDFKRLFGVHRSTFEAMVQVMQEREQSKQKAGRTSKLSVPDQVLVTLQYWREYRTYFHIAQDWSVAESTLCRTVQRVETTLIRSGKFRLPGKKHLLTHPNPPKTITVDVSESPIERPKRYQKRFYSGKKKRHTLKIQLVVDQHTQQIICTAYGKGRRHDFKLLCRSKVRLHPQSEGLGDKGYQGWQKLHPKVRLPKKKPKGGKLSATDKQYNRTLAQQRVVAEHVNRRLKIFKILSERYRNRRRRFGLRCNLIAALYNYELALAS